jgi:hypothetical protein
MMSNYFRKVAVSAALVGSLAAGSAAAVATTVDDNGANGLRVVEKDKKDKKADAETQRANGL